MEINKDDLRVMAGLRVYYTGVLGLPIVGGLLYVMFLFLTFGYSSEIIYGVIAVIVNMYLISYILIKITYRMSVALIGVQVLFIVTGAIIFLLLFYVYTTKGDLIFSITILSIVLIILKFYLGYRVELKRTREPFFKKNVKLGNIDLDLGVVNLFGGMYYPSSYAFNKDILKENNFTRLLYVATIYFFFTDTDFKFTTYTSLGLVPAYYIAVNMMSMAGQRYAFARIIRKWEVANNRKLKTDLGVLMEKCDKINESLVKQGKKPINFFWRAMRGKIKGLEGLSA